ncbi:MAG TPA: PTS fructose transporter subunit IIA [Candidatus Binatia bacterium]|nr:PTS fructose transporter subunit IIA [Candidatus Binatia bacterium]
MKRETQEPDSVSVGVLLVTHGKMGHYLLETMADMIGPLPLPADVLEVRRVQDPNVLLRQGSRMIQRLDNGAGVLILTDAFGSTPSNIATRLQTPSTTLIVAGINLPMLVRVFNYPALDLKALAAAAIEGGQRGVALCDKAPDSQ